MKALLLILSAMTMAGCEESRYRPAQQAEDYKICTSAGMAAYLNGFSEVRCMPPVGTKQ